jgi:Tetratricopeptide repeat
MHGRVLAVRQRHLGIEHPDTLLTMNNLAYVYRSRGRYDDAEILHGWALAGLEKQLGVEHPVTLMSMQNLSDLYQAQGRDTEAQTLRRRAASLSSPTTEAP